MGTAEPAGSVKLDSPPYLSPPPTQAPLRPTADLWSGPISGGGVETGDSGQFYLKQEVILI